MNNSIPTKIYIAATGMITPIGENSETTIAAVKAGINRYQDSPFTNKYSYPMKLASIPDELLPKLKPTLSKKPIKSRQMRMISMASVAINEVFNSVSLDHSVPLFLATPESIINCESGIDEHFLQQIIDQSEADIDLQNSRLFNTGRAGGIQAINLVFEYFKTTGQNYALVGGVDTFIDSNILGCLDEQDRVLAEESLQGFVPGEASSFMLFVSEQMKHKFPNIKSEVFKPGISQEPGHFYSEEPMLGNGLTEAFKLAIESAQVNKIDVIYGSLNGESFQSKEFGIAMTRNSQSISTQCNVEHPADCYGDLGAATAPTLLSISQNNTIGSLLIYCSSDMALRGAVCINTYT